MDLRILGILAHSKEKMKADLAHWEKELRDTFRPDQYDLFPSVTNREGYQLLIEYEKGQIKIIDEFFKEQKGE